MAQVKDKAKKGQATKQAPAATAPKVAKGTVGKDGVPVTGSGAADKRFKYKPGERPTRTKGNAPGVTRTTKMVELLSDKPYTFVREGYDANGVKSATGAKLKKFYVIKGKSGKPVNVGKGEMEKYAGVKAPSKRAKKAEAETTNSKAFTKGKGAVKPAGKGAKAKAAAEKPAEGEGKSEDLSFLDEGKGS